MLFQMSLLNHSLFPRGISKLYVLYRHEFVSSVKMCSPSNLLNTNNIYKCHFSVRVKSPPKSKSRLGLKSLGIGFGVGAIATGVYTYYNTSRKVDTAILNSATGEDYFLQDVPPKHTVSRSIYNSADRSGLKITLYQFQTCPFCCKVRVFLDYYGFSYDVVEVNSLTRKQTKWSSYRKVPFIIIEQEGIETVMQLRDSSMIISALMSFIINKEKTLEEIVKGYPIVCYMNDGKKKPDIMNKYNISYGEEFIDITKEMTLEEKKWRTWVDDVYVHTLSPNIYRTMNESFQAFKWLSKEGDWEEHFKTWERLLVTYVGSIAMYFIGKRLKKRHNLKDDVRRSFYDETNIWLKEVKCKGGKFLGGNEPNLADLGVYGVLSAVEGCDAFQDLLANTTINRWFCNMKKVVQGHQGEKYLNQRGSNI